MTDGTTRIGWNAGRVLAPDAEFLYLAARTAPTAAQRARIDVLIRGGIDWPAVLLKALYHGVLPQVGAAMEASAAEEIPAAAFASVQDQQRQNAALNMQRMAGLLRLSELLGTHGIRTLHFKGPILAQHAFGNLAMRMFADLDVLIPEAEARRARDLLLEHGYTSSLSPAGEEFHLQRSYWIGMWVPSKRFKVDLHWKLADPFFRYEPDVESLWERAQAISIGGSKVETFGVEDTVLVLAAHGFKHAYSRYKWVLDLAEWIRVHPDLRWSTVRRLGGELHVERILTMSLGLVHSYDPRLLPPEIVAWVEADPRSVQLVRQVLGAMFYGDTPIEGLRAEWFHARGRERHRDALSYLGNQGVRRFKRAVTPNEKDRSTLRLPAGLGVLYYAVRPVRLASRWLRRQGPDRS